MLEDVLAALHGAETLAGVRIVTEDEAVANMARRARIDVIDGLEGDGLTPAVARAADLGTRGIDGGPLANSVAAEALTSVLIGINRRYKVDGAGIRITGIRDKTGET